MYDRAPRDITFVVGSTPQHVGPGSYNHKATTLKILHEEGYAPFMSLVSRESSWNASDDKMAAPGPGHYDPKLPREYVKGASTMLSKSKRFELKPDANPGPGAYELKTGWNKSCLRVHCSAPPELATKNKRVQVKFFRKSVAPSIPCIKQSYGYEETTDGSLKKQQPPCRDATLGPAFYGPLPYETQATRQYKGNHFGRMRGSRMKFVPDDIPGPGEYDPYLPNDCSKSILDNVSLEDRERCNFQSYVPRYLDQVVHTVKREDLPGPGSYNLSRTFDVNPSNKPGEHPPFLTEAERFLGIKNDIPAPGTYDDPRTALENLKKLLGMKSSPFGVTAVRFVKARPSDTPGPDAYMLKGMVEEMEGKVRDACRSKCAFGVCDERMYPVTRKDEAFLPGPASYQIEEKLCRPVIVHMSSNFASQTNRLSNPPGMISDIPPPGLYNVETAFRKLVEKRELQPPRTEEGKRRQGSFLSSSSRFAPPRDIVVPEPDPVVPGPGMYCPKVAETYRGSFRMPKDCRFRGDTNDTPGPGTYEISPLVQDTCVKGTFNATLNNPLKNAPMCFKDSNEVKQEMPVCL